MTVGALKPANNYESASLELLWSGITQTVLQITRMVRSLRPQIIFLSETKKRATNMERLCVRWGFDTCLSVDCIGENGRLNLLHIVSSGLESKSYSPNHIDVVIKTEPSSQSWRFTNIYGFPKLAARFILGIFQLLKYQMDLPWLCVMDFNELKYSNEKLGGAPRSNVLMNNFNYVILDYGLHDIPFTKPLFTWQRGEGSAMILERLDKGLG